MNGEKYRGCTFSIKEWDGIGIGKYPDRKKWCLYQMVPPNIIRTLAYFQSEEAAEATEAMLSRMIIHEDKRVARLPNERN